MEIEKFRDQVKRLKRVYGDSSYPDDRIDILWDKIKNKSGVVFREAVDKFISERKTAPMIPEIMETFAFLEKTENPAQNKAEQEGPYTPFTPKERGAMFAMISHMARNRIDMGDQLNTVSLACHFANSGDRNALKGLFFEVLGEKWANPPEDMKNVLKSI